MAATSIAAQLQALKSYVNTDTDVQRRPITRPSVLFNAKEAADLDIDTIFNIALSGLEVLSNVDDRFQNHKHDLLSHKSRELDRELMGIEENNRMNASISSYLRLLSGHLQSPSAFKTLEYLVRRYKIHVYNTEELILCALPYHDTHAFVRIVQLIDFGNSRWRFLDGVKASGAAPPREVIVQQCIRDLGVLEVICNYATPIKKHHPSTPVISFCTAVVVEALGSLATVDSDVVKRILPFLDSGLQSGGKGSSDYKAGTLMIVGLLAKKFALSPKVVNSLVRSVAELARADVQASTDAQRVQLSIMALINIVQLQSVETLPKKVVDILIEIRELPGILLQLIARFSIDRFLILLLESLVNYSSSDNMEEDGRAARRNIRRAVLFYGLVNKLAENHRSLFVPYFKYLFEGSIQYLTDDDGGMSSHPRKRKRAKLQKSENGENEANDLSSLEKWHLRALVLSSLHKCFLYDAGSPKFLDSSKFQLVLKPIVSQLAFEPPASLADYPDIPSAKEVDDVLVSCVGQMAVTAGSDLLWKPLNHEVLMQTRNEMVRSRLLGLKIVKYLVENLKEEYLVLLAETIPFLAELLKDVELPVKTLAQETLKELESMSGKNLREYF